MTIQEVVAGFQREKQEAVLTPQNCTVDMQSILLDYSLKGMTLDAALLKILNVSIFSGVDVMGKWKNMPESHKQFVELWLNMHPEDSYTNHCFRNVKNICDIPNAVMLEIFNVRQDRPEWIDEFHQLMTVMSIEPDDRFFEELDKIPVYETRLDFMTGNSKKERIYLIRMVGKWMKSDYEQVSSCEKLRQVYPELFFYLSHAVHQEDADLKGYLARYKAHKLENTLPADENVYFAGFQTDVYDNRYSVLADNIDGDTIILWIDALGVEWLPLLSWTIKEHCDGKIVSTSVGQAILPTETCYNDLWSRMDTPYSKLDKLDKLAHKGVVDEPDYYDRNIRVYFFCMVLSYSRMRFVYFSREPFRTKTAVDAHKYAFRYFGGRTQTILYDQDRLFVVSEKYGNITLVPEFEDFVRKAGFSVVLCHKSDPQTKGKVESFVRYVKEGFLQGRLYTGIDSLNSAALEWLDKECNGTTHDRTRKAPRELFREESKL